MAVSGQVGVACEHPAPTCVQAGQPKPASGYEVRINGKEQYKIRHDRLDEPNCIWGDRRDMME